MGKSITRTRRQKAIETTAVIPVDDTPPPAMGDNNPPVATPVEPPVVAPVAPPVAPPAEVKPVSPIIPVTDQDEAILAHAIAAFEQRERGAELIGSAVQRLAAAIMEQHAAWVETGEKKTPPMRMTKLTDCAEVRANEKLGIAQSGKVDSHYRSLLADLKKRFVNVKMTETVNGVTKPLMGHALRQAQKRETARNALMGRALTFAAKLALCGYGLDSFKPDTGTFAVHKDLILPHDHRWTGFMHDAETPLVTIIPLDGSSYQTNVKVADAEGTKPGSTAASVEAFVRATNIVVLQTTVDAGGNETTTTSNTEQREPDAGQGGTDNAVDYAKVDYEKLDPDKMVEALYQRFFGVEPDHKDPSASGALLQETWTHFTDLLMWAEEEQKRNDFVKDALDKALGRRAARLNRIAA